MCDMRKVGAARLQLIHVFQRALQPKMRRVRLDAQAIEHQHFQIAQAFDRGRRYLAQIRRVGKVVEAISNYRQPAVDYFERSNFQIGGEAEGRAVNDRMRHDLWQAAAKMRKLEDIFEDPPNVDPGSFVRVKSQTAVAKVQR